MTFDAGASAEDAYAVNVDAKRLFGHRLRHVLNPVAGVWCGLGLGAALFLIAVQLLFDVRPSVAAMALGALSILAYLTLLFRTWQTSRLEGAYQLTLTEPGVQIEMDEESHTFAWSRFKRWLEDEDDFVMASGGMTNRLVLVLPKDHLSDARQDVVRSTLHAHIDPNDDPISDAFVEMGWDEEPPRREDRRQR